MGEVQVYLENGFDHDRVTVAVGGSEHTEPDVSTRYQVGLGSVVTLEVSDVAPTVVRITVPGRGLTAEADVDPTATPHVRVSITSGSLDVQAQATPPMFA